MPAAPAPEHLQHFRKHAHRNLRRRVRADIEADRRVHSLERS